MKVFQCILKSIKAVISTVMAKNTNKTKTAGPNADLTSDG